MKLIIADLDGTLVHQQKISKETLKTVQELHNQGFYFSVATGRHMNATREIVKELSVKLPVICSNGAYIYDFAKEKMIHQVLIDLATAVFVIDILNDEGFEYLLYTTNKIIGTEKAKSLLISKIGQVHIEVAEKKALKKYAQLGLVKILVIEKDLERINQLKNRLAIINEIYAIQSQDDFLDIGNRLANKGHALEVLSSHLGISLNECLAIGDQENDIEMILKAQIGVAMGNGVKALKEASNFVTKSYEDNGFSYAIEQYILNKK